jgi:hypothetical protein
MKALWRKTAMAMRNGLCLSASWEADIILSGFVLTMQLLLKK